MDDSLHYLEWPAPKPLDAIIECAWSLTATRAHAEPDVVFPDGRCEMIIHLGKPMLELDEMGHWVEQPAQLFATQHRRALTLKAQAPLDCLGVRLAPAASALLLGERLPVLKDQILDLSAVHPVWAKRFFDSAIEARECNSSAPFWPVISEFFADYRPDQAVAEMVHLLTASDGVIKVSELAARIGKSPRTLQTLFARHVGLSAKEFARIIRLQGLIKALDQGEDGIADAAHSHGYSDQSHATRESRNILGQTPGNLKQALADQRFAPSTLRMAAAFVRGSA